MYVSLHRAVNSPSQPIPSLPEIPTLQPPIRLVYTPPPLHLSPPAALFTSDAAEKLLRTGLAHWLKHLDFGEWVNRLVLIQVRSEVVAVCVEAQ